MNIFRITVADPAAEIVTYGAGALLRAERSADGVTYLEFATSPVDADATVYPFADPIGAPTTWYRTRLSDADNLTPGAYGAPFQVEAAALDYATLEGVKLRLGITDTTADSMLATIIGEVNDWLEGAVGAPVGPSTATTLTLDGRDARSEHQMLFIRHGVRSVTALTVSGRAVATWYLRPLEHDRPAGWPAQELWLDSGSFPRGRADVVLTGTFGFAAIPSELTEVAEVVAVRAYLARRIGQADTSGSDQQGQPQVSRYVSGRDRDTIARYRKRLSRTGGFGSIALTNQ